MSEEIPVTPESYQQLLQQVAFLTQQIASLQPATQIAVPAEDSHGREPKMQNPSAFSGSKKDARNFVLQLENIFAAQPRRYATDEVKIRFTISLLTGSALNWANALQIQHRAVDQVNPLELTSWKKFSDSLLEMFDDPDRVQSAERQLQNIRQGKRPVAVMASEFRRLVAETNWPESVLFRMFYMAINPEIRIALAAHPRPEKFQEYVQLAIRLDNCLYEANQENRAEARRNRVRHTNHNDSTAMDVDNIQTQRGPLSKEEKDKRRKNGECLYCGKPGHRVANCPAKPKEINKIATIKNDKIAIKVASYDQAKN